MKLSQAKDYLPFIQAAAEGKTIQGTPDNGKSWIDWEADEEIEFSDQPSSYRIKPDPREFWLLPSDGLGCGVAACHIVCSEEQKPEWVNKPTTIRVREIIED